MLLSLLLVFFGVVVLISSTFFSCEFDFSTIKFLCNIQFNKTLVLFERFVLLFGVGLAFILSNGRCGRGPGWTSFLLVYLFICEFFYQFHLVVF